MTRQEKALSLLGALLLAAVGALAFRGYLSPVLLVELVMRLCT